MFEKDKNTTFVAWAGFVIVVLGVLYFTAPYMLAAAEANRQEIGRAITERMPGQGEMDFE